MRNFDTGACRSSDAGKFDYEGFMHPAVIKAFAAYMDANRVTEDGGYRDSDNWQKGIPRAAYMKSCWRHLVDLWGIHRGLPSKEGELGAAMGVVFNTFGWVMERMREDPDWYARELAKYQDYRAAELQERRDQRAAQAPAIAA